MKEQAHFGRIIFGSLAVIATAWGVAQITLSLLKNLIAFCAVYDGEEAAEPPSFDEIEEPGMGDRACPGN